MEVIIAVQSGRLFHALGGSLKKRATRRGRGYIMKLLSPSGDLEEESLALKAFIRVTPFARKLLPGHGDTMTLASKKPVL